MESARTVASVASQASSAGKSGSSARTAKSRSRFATGEHSRDAEGGPRKDCLDATPYWALVQEGDWETIKVEAKRPEPWVVMPDENFGWTVGHFAANAGRADVLKILLDVKAALEGVDREGNTMLMLACRVGQVGVAELLLGKKAELNAQNHNGWSALTWAAINGCDSVAELLLKSKADLLLADTSGRTAAMWAAQHGKMGIVEAFLSYGLNLRVTDHAGLTVLDHCQGHLRMAATIMAVGEINECLQAAAQLNDLDGVREAIEAGADIDLRDGDGWTPLMWAAVNGSVDMVQLVVRYGAKPSLLDEHGHVIQNLQSDHLAVGKEVERIFAANERLLEASQRGDWAAAEEELRIGAFINMKDDNARTSLMWAAKEGNAEAVHMLIARNADVNDRDNMGWAAVHFAVIEKNPVTVSMFHFLGADMGVKTYEGDGLLHMAVRADDAVMIQLLLAAGCDPEDMDINLFTPLMMASYQGLASSVSCLVAYGARVEAKSTAAFGERGALSLAVVHGQEQAVAALLRPPQAPPTIAGEAETEEKEEAPAPTKKKTSASRDDSKGSGGSQPTKGGKKVSAKAKEAASGVAAKKNVPVPAKAPEFKGDAPDALLNEAIRRRRQQPWKTTAAPARVVVKETDATGATPLALAVRFRQTAIGVMLLQGKADVNAADDAGTTVVMEAVLTRQTEVVEYMMALGANVEAQNKQGQRAIDMCEDDSIRELLHRKVVLDHIPPSDPQLIEEAEARDAKLLELAEASNQYFRVRLEGLPMDSPAVELEQQIRKLFLRIEAPNPKQIRVVLDPITELPRGHAYADFPDAVGQDLGMRAQGVDLEGFEVRAYKEPRRPN